MKNGKKQLNKWTCWGLLPILNHSCQRLSITKNIIIKYTSGLFFIDNLKMNNEYVMPPNIIGTLRSIDYAYL